MDTKKTFPKDVFSDVNVHAIETRLKTLVFTLFNSIE